jgi:hypothetical protein
LCYIIIHCYVKVIYPIEVLNYAPIFSCLETVIELLNSK